MSNTSSRDSSENVRVQYWREKQREEQLRVWGEQDVQYRWRLGWWRYVVLLVCRKMVHDVGIDLVDTAVRRGVITFSQAASLRLMVRRMTGVGY